VWASELSLSSLDKSERKEAIRFAKQTLDLASRVEASAIVLHLGQVPIDFDLEDKLHQLYQRGLAQSKEYKQIKEFLIKERASGVTPYFEAARESLHQLTREGEKRGIALGLETRFYFHEIPNIEEMEELLKELEGELVGCWYDAGHVEVQRRLGFTCHEDWFAHLGSRIIGTHLHDVRQLSDHRAPGSGDMDWGIIAKHLPSGVIKACEIGEWNDEEYVQRALPFLREKGILD
jgi:sugar phosphate isomerase/epimerase